MTRCVLSPSDESDGWKIWVVFQEFNLENDPDLSIWGPKVMQVKEAKINLRESKEWSKSGQIYNLAHS